MPFGIRPSNVRVCHFTTRASRRAAKLSADGNRWQVSSRSFLLLLVHSQDHNRGLETNRIRCRMKYSDSRLNFEQEHEYEQEQEQE